MSLTIALKAVDGLVLAADSRVTEGYSLAGPKTRDDSVKFLQLNDDWGALTYGFSEIGHAGITSLKDEVLKRDGNSIVLNEMLDQAPHLFKRTSSDWAKSNPEIMRRDKDVGFIIAGYERQKKEFMIFNLQSPEFAPNQHQSGCLLAGQWHVAKFFVQKLYAGDISVEMLKGLGYFLLDATMSVEKTVGGAINLATVTESRGFQWVMEDEIRSIAEKNARFSKQFEEEFNSSLLSVVNDHQKTATPGDGNGA